jgi:hypothetical protein
MRRESSEPCSVARCRFSLSIPGRLSQAPIEPHLCLFAAVALTRPAKTSSTGSQGLCPN